MPWRGGEGGVNHQWAALHPGNKNALNSWLSWLSLITVGVTIAYISSLCSPERKRRMSSRVMTKREPSPAPSRPPSLRQSIPTKQVPTLVNGKAETPAGGRTRSAARNSVHTPPAASSSHSAANTQNTTGNDMFACWFMFTATTKPLEIITICHLSFLIFFFSDSPRLLRGHSSSSTPPVPDKVTPSPPLESNNGGSTRRKLKPPVRHTPGKESCHTDWYEFVEISHFSLIPNRLSR